MTKPAPVSRDGLRMDAPRSACDSSWSMEPERVLAALDVQPNLGLDESEVRSRRHRFGPNRLRRMQTRSAWRILAEQFMSLMMALLAVAAVIAFLMVDWIDGVAIVAVIAINAVIGFVTELKAVRSMEALYRLGQVNSRVRRAGHVQEVPASALVPGDVVVVEGGDVITADLRLLGASKLQADESALTGEPMAVDKRVTAVAPNAPLAERSCMLYKGTAVSRGSAEGVVVATGLATELGAITALVEQTDSSVTPLERRLERLGRRLIALTLLLAAAVGITGLAAGRELIITLQTAIALAVATVPEGLPVVATIALARGMWRMARHNALINRLAAVETLGATSVICTDKTGTLTENRMTATVVATPGGDFYLKDAAGVAAFLSNGKTLDAASAALLGEVLEAGVLCNNAELAANGTDEEIRATGDPLEIALLQAGAVAGISRGRLIAAAPEVREESFDPDNRMMATFHRRGGRYQVAVKGAPEAVIAACTHLRTRDGGAQFDGDAKVGWLARNERLAADGLRVLAVAAKEVGDASAAPYAGLTFLGLVGFVDPPRSDVADAIAACRSAGIRVVMVTGDQALTAIHIARQVGLLDEAEVPEAVMAGARLPELAGSPGTAPPQALRAAVFTRVSPKQKLDLIAIHQAQGAIVAMTGDGVNDAPALKKADIGIAMGQRGTQVAREAADMVLKDDAFRTIVLAVEQGRVIFDNIRKFVLYLLSCNVSEVLVVALATLVNAPLPILPLQILFLNLVTDVFPALALGIGPGDPAIMRRPPQPAGEPILAPRHWLAIGAYGALITASVLGAFAAALLLFRKDATSAVTISFLTLALTQLWHVFNMREPGTGWWRNDIAGNLAMWPALFLCVALVLAAVYVPALATTLRVLPPDAPGWGLIIGFSLIPWLVGQVYLTLRNSRAGRVPSA